MKFIKKDSIKNKQEENKNIDKVSNETFLYWILFLFGILFFGITFCISNYFDKINDMLKIGDCVKNLNISKPNYQSFISEYKKCIPDIKIEETFMQNYYAVQSNWLNIWLIFTGMVLTILTVIMPIIAKKNNERLEDKTEDLFKQAREAIKECNSAEKVISEEIKDFKDSIKDNINKIEINSIKSDVNSLFSEGLLFSSNEEFAMAINRFKKALKSMDKLNELGYVDEDKNKTNIARSKMSFYIGNCYRKKNNFEKSLVYYEKSLKINPEDLDSLKGSIISYLELKYYQKCIENCYKFLKIQPDDLEIQYYLIKAYFFNKQINEAFRILENYVKNPNSYIEPYDYNDCVDIIKESKISKVQKEKIIKILGELYEKNFEDDEYIPEE